MQGTYFDYKSTKFSVFLEDKCLNTYMNRLILFLVRVFQLFLDCIKRKKKTFSVLYDKSLQPTVMTEFAVQDTDFRMFCLLLLFY